MTPLKTDRPGHARLPALLKLKRPNKLCRLCIAAMLAAGNAAVPASTFAQSQRSEDSAVLRKSTESDAAFNVRQAPQSSILPIDENPAAASSSTAAKPAMPSAEPDERPLWALLKAQRDTEFDAQLRRQQTLFPLWRVAPAMLAERERQRQDTLITQALADNAGSAELRAAMASYPDQFGCAHIDRLWHAADILGKAGDIDAAMHLYQSAIPDCTPAKNRIATLYKAQQILPPAQLDELINREATDGKRDAQSDAQFARLRYDRALSALALLPPASNQAADAASHLAPEIRMYLDAAGATMTGYIMLAHRRTDQADDWFALAQSYAPAAVDPQLGRIQVQLERNQLDAAQAALSQTDVTAEQRVVALRAQLAMRRAAALNKNHQYEDSLAQLDLAQQLGAPAPELAQLRGWNRYGLAQYTASQAIFSELYRSTPNNDNAEGLALSYATAGNFDALKRDAAASQGPLANYAVALQSQRLYYQKRFIEAHALTKSLPAESLESAESAAESATSANAGNTAGPAHYAPQNLDGIDSASVSAGLQTSNHVGTAGQGKLVTIAPSVRAEWIAGTAQYNLRYRQLSLDAGPISGSLGPAAAAFATHPSSGKVSDAELQMDIRNTISNAWLDDLQWEAALGLTGGDSQTVGVNGQLSIGKNLPATTWSASIGRAPVRDSLLSWRGVTDPYSGADQGQVARNTVAGRALWQLDPKWTLSGNAEAGVLTGRQVETNNSAALDLGLSRDLGIAGFDYFSVGPALHYLHYAHNLSGYTLGQGGYYSPQRSLSAGLAMQWLSQEDRRFQWQGNVEVGRNVVHESAAPCFPLGVPAGYAISAATAATCSVAGTVDSGIYTHAQLGATWRIAPHWQLGALGDANITPGRDKQFAALVFIRYTFDARKSLFSRDLPVSTRDFYMKLDDSH